MSGWTPTSCGKIGEAEDKHRLEEARRHPQAMRDDLGGARRRRPLRPICQRVGQPLYRRAITSGDGRIRAGGVEKDVTFAGAPDEDQPAIDHAYHTKYDRYGPTIVGSVTGVHAHDLTIRLVPNLR